MTLYNLLPELIH